jgi:ribonuclease P protein component
VIQSLFKEGKSFSLFPLRVVYLEIKDQPNRLQAGFSVSNRQFKRAVDRNKIKRLMRESYRLQKNELFAKLDDRKVSAFFIYTGKTIAPFSEVFEKMGASLLRLQKEFKEK